ncbi:MAG: sulfatase-like hydrolase/transferase, partial [Rubripirellula sp.]
GPSDYGFDECFFLPGSLDMFPYAYIRGKQWQGKVTAKKGWSAFNRVGPAAEDFVDTEVLSTFCNEAGTFIQNQASIQGQDKQSKPFFLFVALTAPHTPTSPEAEFKGKSRIGIYGDFVMNADACIGRIRKQLADAGIAENTVVMVASDHGPGHYSGRRLQATANQMQKMEKEGHFSAGPWRGYKFSAFEGGLRIPFATVWPGVIKPGGVSNALIGLNDLMATWADIAGIQLSSRQGPDSSSFLSVLQQPDQSHRRNLVIRGTRSDAFRDGDWKLILGPGSGSSGQFFTEPRSEDAWKKAIKVFGRNPKNHKELEDATFVQLYNLKNDPAETTDVSVGNQNRIKNMLADYQKLIRDGRSTPGAPLSNDRDVKAFRPPAFVWKK